MGTAVFSIVVNKACYTGDFASIFRAARGSNMSSPIHEEDLDGKEPLPKYLAKARVRLYAKDAPRQALLISKELDK
jgi:hypothetical protein